MQDGIQSGEIVGDRYCILYELGRGRWGRTYLAQDRKGARDRCVLKVFAPAIQEARALQKAVDLFEQEARVLSPLSHPQIPKFRAFFRAFSHRQERWFCAYDCVKGLNYGELLQLREQQGRRFSEAEAIEFLQKLLPVLVYIHQHGTIHGDITPDRVMLRQSDRLPVLLDWGGFKRAAAIVEELSSVKAFYAGEPGYAPEEQVRAGVVLPQSDLYALGATAIALLSGREPRHWLDPQTQTPIWERVSASPALREILQQMLAQKPSDRFPNATAVLKAIQPLLHPSWDDREVEEDIPVAEDLGEGIKIPIAEDLGDTEAKEKEDKETGKQGDKEEFQITNYALRIKKSSPSSQAKIQPERSSITEDAMPTPFVTQAPSQKKPPALTRHNSPSKIQNWAIALVKSTLVVLLSLSSGTVGWWAGKAWIDRQAQSQASEGVEGLPEPEALSFLPADDPEPAPSATLSEDERQRKLVLRDRRLRSGLHYEFFTALVNEFFWLGYPSQAGQTPSLAPEDDLWRERWDTIAAELLDQLTFLSLPARQRLGRYDPQERERAGLAAERLNLSRQALFDLADAQLSYRFPEVADREPDDGAIAQIEQAIVFDQLKALTSGPTLAQISPNSSSSGRVAGTLKPGEGKVFWIRLEGGQLVNAFFDADSPAFFGVYSPRGDRLLEDARSRSWSGQVPETGVYQFVLVSQTPAPLNYSLNLAF
jgi:serine/threonine protein kinase, bacterial